MIEQGSAEWHEQRLGRVTASRIKDLMAKTKTGYSTSRNNYLMELLCQRLTGRRGEGYINSAMQRGTELEPMARGMYEGVTGQMVVETGFVQHPVIAGAGASPDGLVGDDGLIEIKCPNTAQHVEFLRTGVIDGGYIKQMQFQLMCTGRKWCDYVSFDDRMPDALQLKIKRYQFDAVLAVEIQAEVTSFLAELSALEAEMKSLMEKQQ